MLKLYGYERSPATFRVRIVLGLKGIACEQVAVDLPRDEQRGKAYRRINPQGLVPYLEEGEWGVGQSLAIMEYLDETYPAYPLLPSSPEERALTRQIVNMLACDLHPLASERVQAYLTQHFSLRDPQCDAWYQHWVEETFTALEKVLGSCSGLFCVGDEVTLADCVLIPEIYMARRNGVDLTHYSTLLRIFDHCMGLHAFADATPASSAARV